MSQRKYTLPRHTNLAKQSSRTGAFLVDLAIFAALVLAFYLGCFNLIFNGMTVKPTEEFHQEQIYSYLRFKNENGEISQLNADATFEQFRDRVSYYYLNYLTNVDIKDGFQPSRNWNIEIDVNGTKVAKKDYYNVAWFNKEIFSIKTDNPENEQACLFTYVKNADGTYDKTQLGIPKDSSIVPASEINAAMQKIYVNAFNHFQSQDYVIKMSNSINFIYSLEFVLSAFIAGVITYIIIPWCIKRGRTVGKLVFGLALANKDGYSFENKQLFMRFMPLLVCNLALLIPIWNTLFLLLLVFLIIFLVSFALAMASPTKASLHDFTAQTIVIDDKTSIIFDNEAEEEEYLLNEDGLLETHNDNEEGEEPELKYEK